MPGISISISISGSTVTTIVVVTVVGTIAIVDQVDITEVTMVVVAAVGEPVSTRVAGSWGTGLYVAVAIGAEHKGPGITVVETIGFTLALVLAMEGVGGGSTGHQGQENNCNLHGG